MKNATVKKHCPKFPRKSQERSAISPFGKDIKIEWEPSSEVTSSAGAVYFFGFLRKAGLLDKLLNGSPLRYTSNNAPPPSSVMATLICTILKGGKRYAFANTLRNDSVLAETAGIGGFVSEDSVRRGLSRGTEREWDAWLTEIERDIFGQLLGEDYVIDIDSTVKKLYGHQEFSVKGYNPTRPGRPCHSCHGYLIGGLRVILGVDVHPGNESAGCFGMPALWKFIDSLPAGRLPRLIRGDVSYGSESIMRAAERRKLRYLFKLRRSRSVRRDFSRACSFGKWEDAGDGWEACVSTEHSGAGTSRRRIFLRRPSRDGDAGSKARRKGGMHQEEFAFTEGLAPSGGWDYELLATNDTELSAAQIAQAYRDRGDCENVFDETKNQWGWSGFMTKDVRRCKIVMRLTAIVFNLWNIFTRLADPQKHMEATTSRPMLIETIGRLVRTGRRRILKLTSNHSDCEWIRDVLERIRSFLKGLTSTAEQLSRERIWSIILSAAFVKWLKGKMINQDSERGLPLMNLLN